MLEPDAGGGPLVVRLYGWPFGGDAPTFRAAWESWLLPRLAAHGVAVPDVLASSPGGLLMRYVPGVLLAEVPAEHVAWRAAGEALRAVHECDLVSEIRDFRRTGDVDRESPDGAGERLVIAARRLAEAEPDLKVDVEAVAALAPDVDAIRDDREPRVVHNDPHAWNALVRDDGSGWTFSAWLDWEWSGVGDVTWDLVYVRLLRLADIGPTPDAFYDGYGARPDELRAGLCELSFHLERADRDTARMVPVTYAAALRYLADLPRHVARLRSML